MKIIYKFIKTSEGLIFLLFLLLCTQSVFSQQQLSGKWYLVTGTATGKDMEKIRAEALNRARKNAMEEAGIEINTSSFSLKSESNEKLLDFFHEFTESNARGLILNERNIHFDPPQPLDSTYTFYRVTAHADLLIGLTRGKTDPTFDVKLATDRETYLAYEPVTLHVKTTESGYLTILDVHQDSINVLFPNAINRDNHIDANTDFVFPSGQTYSLEFKTDNGATSSVDLIVAIVTKEDVPFPNFSNLEVKGSRLLVAEKTLTTYAKWLYKIPLNRRKADEKLIQIQKNPKGE